MYGDALPENAIKTALSRSRSMTLVGLGHLFFNRFIFISTDSDFVVERQGWMYLVQEREFVRAGENIYKVGQTVEIGRRLVKYPSGSIPYLVLHTGGNDHVELEKNILQQFRKMFISRKDIGLEYFEGDVGQMMEIIMDMQMDFRLE